MREIRLKDGGVTLVDDADYQRWRSHEWHGSAGYVRCSWIGNGLILHRLIMDAPDGMEVHHVDGDPLNNQRSNLRLLTPAAHRAEHSGPKRRITSTLGPSCLEVRVFESPFDWAGVDADYSRRGL